MGNYVCGMILEQNYAIELFIKGSKTDQRHQGCRRMQHSSGDDVFCPVKVMQEWFRLRLKLTDQRFRQAHHYFQFRKEELGVSGLC